MSRLTETDLAILKTPVHAPIDELAAFAQFMKDCRITEEQLDGYHAEENDRLLAIAKIIDPAAFLPSRRDDDNMSASDALGKARRIMELG